MIQRTIRRFTSRRHAAHRCHDALIENRHLEINPHAKRLIVGLEAVEADLVDRWVASGDLPTLEGLRRGGIWCRPSSLPGLGSDANWMSFLTGIRLGPHGRYFYRQLDNRTYSAERPEEKSWGRDPFWV